MKIDRQIEVPRAETPAERHVVQQPADAALPRYDDHLIEQRVVCDHGRGERLDQVADVGVGKVLSKSPDCRGREDDVADFAQADEENAQMSYGSTMASSTSMTGMSSLIG